MRVTKQNHRYKDPMKSCKHEKAKKVEGSNVKICDHCGLYLLDFEAKNET